MSLDGDVSAYLGMQYRPILAHFGVLSTPICSVASSVEKWEVELETSRTCSQHFLS